MDLVHEGEGAVGVGDVTQLLQGADGARHAVHRLECDQLGKTAVHLGEEPVQVLGIVVFEDVARSPAVPDALDHAGVVPGVTEDLTARQLGGQRVEGRVVGHVARSEDQRRLLLVEGGNLCLQVLVEERVARDVPGSPRPHSVLLDGLVHGLSDHRVGGHSQVVVGAPHGDILDRNSQSHF